MIERTQSIRMSRGGDVHEATVSWWFDDQAWVVALESAAFDRLEARENDAFEALCTLRDELEPLGWRIGVAGSQAGVWPSGMARDQGGGQRCYRITVEGPYALVDTFEPVDPTTVTTVAEQRADADRMYESLRARPPREP